MVRKEFSLRLRRKSFDIEGFKKTNEQGFGAFGNLGFWANCYLGFQTLGSIYGINPEEDTNMTMIGDIGTSPLYVYTGQIFADSLD
jgi:hypothetical protein